MDIMGIIDSIQLTFSRYFDIESKADRKEFWLFFSFYLLGTVASVLIDHLAGSFFYIPLKINIGLFSGIFLLLTTIPFLTVTVRRLIDVGFSKLFILLLIVPFGNLPLLIICALKSKVAK